MATKAFKKLPPRAKRAAFANMAKKRSVITQEKKKNKSLAKRGFTGAQRNILKGMGPGKRFTGPLFRSR